ncbi:hypothetical protein [Pseudogemmobacter sp. W21_MBD1_M6]|uniref:hypothetical protein n=1 Tax=Pseudogemmobacter sp. W21_MBD1_M6 TaxID=3240271 RepID=UPI003F99B95A
MLPTAVIWVLRALIVNPVSAHFSIKRRAFNLGWKGEVTLCIVLAILLSRAG